METRPNLRVLPILIIVAMLAFSVRLVDFASGVSSLNGSAFAEEEAPSDDTLQSLEPETAAGDATEDGEKTMADELKEAMAEEEVVEELENPEWRDPSYEDFEYSSVTQGVLDDMAARRKKLDAREKELMTREALLRAAEKEIDRKFQELATLRAEIESLLEQQSEEEKSRIESLVKIYEGMKPKDAARIFDTLDLDVLLSVMSRMSERRLSPILAAMNPERARTITIMLAEEKKLPELPTPTQQRL